ncbi:copper-containing nitrite reductase [Deinococcus sp. NW-56]|uniref:copper-containing nitrite reductase n=1 Tax=Deinococcus sp. NW-56 TaxID=2080419 RepID=UPI001F48A0EC|nr:copper-containing nitrite reductase [Deinococcus sp. NW-56]
MQSNRTSIDRAVSTTRNVVISCTLGITAILLGAALIPGEAQPAAVPAAATAQATGDQGGAAPTTPVLASTAVLATTAQSSAATTQGKVVSYTLETVMEGGKMGFRTPDGTVNPTLRAQPGDTVKIKLINGDGIRHDIAFPDLGQDSADVEARGSSVELSFKVDKAGTFSYICTLPGHVAAGMTGQLVVGQAGAAQPAAKAPSIARDPTDLPPPLARRAPKHLKYEFTTIEKEGHLADGTSYTYWTFDGQVPGPFVRVRVGDTVDVTLKNAEDSVAPHSIDFHAVTGPGGGAASTQTAPGGETSFTFKAMKPGLYVYHCATPMVAHHITSGMYGLILVEPEAGLPKVDREFYVMQGELYTEKAHGQKGDAGFDVAKLLDEDPEYFVFNGSTDALTKEFPLKAKVGETVRIFFGVGGPNYISNFHVIGEIFDKVYPEAALSNAPLKDVQTTLVPAGGATVVDLKLEVPGTFPLVDHALSRAELGLKGLLQVEGPENHAIYKGEVQSGH